jgi:homoserine kinase type II
LVKRGGVNRVVYTEVSDDERAAFLADYDIGEMMALKGIAEGVENTNYMLHTKRGYYFLTLYEKLIRRTCRFIRLMK